MPRYIDADAILSRLPDDLPYKASVKRVLIQATEADVVPRSEYEKVVFKLECLLCHATGSRLSKSTYSLRTMEMAVTDYIQERYDEATKDAARAIFDDIRRLFCLAPKDGKIFAVWSPLCPDLMISAENGKEALEKAREVSDTYSQAFETPNIVSNAKRGVRLPMFNEFLELEKKYIPTMEDALND